MEHKSEISMTKKVKERFGLYYSLIEIQLYTLILFELKYSSRNIKQNQR